MAVTTYYDCSNILEILVFIVVLGSAGLAIFFNVKEDFKTRLEAAFDGLGLYCMIFLWMVATFSSYVFAVILAFLMIFAYIGMVGLDFYHKNDALKRSTGLAVVGVLFFVMALVAVINKNYYA